MILANLDPALTTGPMVRSVTPPPRQAKRTSDGNVPVSPLKRFRETVDSPASSSYSSSDSSPKRQLPARKSARKSPYYNYHDPTTSSPEVQHFPAERRTSQAAIKKKSKSKYFNYDTSSGLSSVESSPLRSHEIMSSPEMKRLNNRLDSWALRKKSKALTDADVIADMKPLIYNFGKPRSSDQGVPNLNMMKDLRQANPEFKLLRKLYRCNVGGVGCKISRKDDPDGRIKNSILITSQGDYYFLSDVILGSGKFGITKLAQNAKSGEWVVVKSAPLASETSNFQENLIRRKSFDSEKEVLAKLEDPARPDRTRLIDSIERYSDRKMTDKGYIITPISEGVPLDKLPWNQRNADAGFVMNEAAIRKIKDNILNEIKYMEGKGYVHGDLHHENILVNPKTLDTKFIDFGLVHKNNLDYQRNMVERSVTLPLDIALGKREKSMPVDLDKMFVRDGD